MVGSKIGHTCVADASDAASTQVPLRSRIGKSENAAKVIKWKLSLEKEIRRIVNLRKFSSARVSAAASLLVRICINFRRSFLRFIDSPSRELDVGPCVRYFVHHVVKIDARSLPSLFELCLQICQFTLLGIQLAGSVVSSEFMNLCAGARNSRLCLSSDRLVHFGRIPDFVHFVCQFVHNIDLARMPRGLIFIADIAEHSAGAAAAGDSARVRDLWR